MQATPDPRPVTPAELEAWRDFLRAYDYAMRTLDDDLRAAHDMSVGDYDVLVQLSFAPGRRLRMRDLAKATLFSPSGITRACERLEDLGLVAREPSADDARGTDAVLTTAGRRRLREADTTHIAGIQRVFARHFDAEQLAAFSKVVRAISGSQSGE